MISYLTLIKVIDLYLICGFLTVTLCVITIKLYNHVFHDIVCLIVSLEAKLLSLIGSSQ